jgi:hypothetical protein
MRSRRLLFWALVFSGLAVARDLPAQDTWVAHLSDPMVFEPSSPAVAGRTDTSAEQSRQRINRLSFADALRAIGPGAGAPLSQVSAVVITGNFGLNALYTSSSAGHPTLQVSDDAIDTLATYIAQSAVKQIFVVAGSSDILGASADSTATAKLGDVFRRVQHRLDSLKTGIEVHDVTKEPSDLFAPRLRVIGVPSYSFANRDSASSKVNARYEESQIRRVGDLTNQAAAESLRALLVEDIPDLDDPRQAVVVQHDMSRLAEASDSGQTGRSGSSLWIVPDHVRTLWEGAINSPTVLAVLGGHLHDSHREIYRQPYDWSGAPAQPDRRKLDVAPPIAMDFQDQSPIQARGFTLLHIDRKGVHRTLYWFDPSKGTFAPDSGGAPVRPPRATDGIIVRAALALWGVGAGASTLMRATLWAIAFMLALMTAVAVWKIKPATPSGAPTPAETVSKTGDDSVLKTNFGRAVITGVLGFTAITLIDDQFWKGSGPTSNFSAKAYYIVLFVVWFATLLLLSGVLRGIAEAVRARINIQYLPPPITWGDGPKTGRALVARLFRWCVSLQVPLLLFLDTFWNVVRGENELQSKVYSDEIAITQDSIVAAFERIRSSVESTIIETLTTNKPNGVHTSPGDVRVGISVRSAQTQDMFYVAKAPDSLGAPFGSKSIAFQAADGDIAIWWLNDFYDSPDVVINSPTPDMHEQRQPPAQPLTTDVKLRHYLRLKDYNEKRKGADYDAFIVLPIPWRRHGGRAGCLHISFRTDSQFKEIFVGLEPTEQRSGPVDSQQRVLNCDGAMGMFERRPPSAKPADPPDPADPAKPVGSYIAYPEVRVILWQAITVAGALLCQFNEQIYKARAARTCG